MTNRRRDDSVTRKITSFRFDVDLLKRFSEFAKVNGYNCTEGLEVLMIKAMEGLLPKKESIVRKIAEDKVRHAENIKDVMNTTIAMNSSDIMNSVS